MRNFVLALVLLAASAACAPQASGPPQTGETATSQTVSSPEAAASAGAPTEASPAAPDTMASPAAPDAMASPGELPPGHPQVTGGASPPPSHMTAGGMNVTETEGAVVKVEGDEMILARPSGTELKFLLPHDMKMLPPGKTREDLKEGTRIQIQIRTSEKGMEAQTITVEGLPPATK